MRARLASGWASDRGKQVENISVEGGSQSLNVVDADIPLAALDAAYIGSMQACHIGEHFLRYAPTLPPRTQVRGKTLPR